MSSLAGKLRLFFQKGKNSLNFFCKNTQKHAYMSILSQGTDTVNKKLAVFTYAYFFVTEAQKSSININSKPQLINFTGSYTKKLISSVASNKRDLYLLC